MSDIDDTVTAFDFMRTQDAIEDALRAAGHDLPDLADVVFVATEAVGAVVGADAPTLPEPDWEEDGVLGWLVGKGHDVELDDTGQGEPTFRIGDDHVTKDRVRHLRNALSAALAVAAGATTREADHG